MTDSILAKNVTDALNRVADLINPEGAPAVPVDSKWLADAFRRAASAEKEEVRDLAGVDLSELAQSVPPRPYDLDDPAELQRLYREVRGYLHTCHHKHGTDWEGRKHAMDALDQLTTPKP